MAEITHGAVCRPKLGRKTCGDAYAVFEHSRRPVIVVADGLGSGEDAAVAGQAAVETVAAHLAAPVGELFELCHAALSETRGAALGIVAIDRTAQTIEAGAVGNVEIRSRREFGFNPVSVSGIVGANYRPPRLARSEYARGDWLVLHTDGLRAGFDLDTALLRPVQNPQALADWLADTYGRDDDDLTVLVVQLP